LWGEKNKKKNNNDSDGATTTRAPETDAPFIEVSCQREAERRGRATSNLE